MNEKFDIGFIGDGQLAQMMTEAAAGMELSTSALGKNLPHPSPAEQVGAAHIVAPDLYDPEGLTKLVESAKVTTPEIEHFNTEFVGVLLSRGYDIEPSPESVGIIHDKFEQHKYLASKDIPVAPFFRLASAADLDELRDLGKPLMVKRRFGAYDGKGNMRWDGSQSWEDITGMLLKPGESESDSLYAEEMVEFARELSGLVVKGKNGEVVGYPLVQTFHSKDSVCDVVVSPAPLMPNSATTAEELEAKGRNLALATGLQFKGAGVLAVEMFLTPEGDILVNEVAPRVHNSGHLSIEGHKTSQFEQHIRAITGMQLGSTEIVTPAVMINVLGRVSRPTGLAYMRKRLDVSDHAEVKLYGYGKDRTDLNRKMGHITVTADTVVDAYEVALKAREIIDI